MKNYLIAATLLLCACTPAGPFSSAPTHRLSIDGQMWQVQQMPAGKDTWAANKEDTWGGWLDPAITSVMSAPLNKSADARSFVKPSPIRAWSPLLPSPVTDNPSGQPKTRSPVS